MNQIFTLFTNATSERFISRVVFHMLNKFTGLLECFTTNRTLVQIGVGVRELMFSQQSGRFETFVTIIAWEWITFSVCLHVQYQTARIDETLFAHFALMRFSGGMRSMMNHQATRLCEGF